MGKVWTESGYLNGGCWGRRKATPREGDDTDYLEHANARIRSRRLRLDSATNALGEPLDLCGSASPT